MWAMIFQHEDGERDYLYSASLEFPEWGFRNPRVRGLTWTFDGDTWVSEPTVFHGPDWPGVWTIAHTDAIHPSYLFRVH